MTDPSNPNPHPTRVGDAATPALPLETVRTQLLARLDTDQAARHANAAAREHGEADWSTVAAVDDDNLAYLTPLIATHGWLSSDLVGDDGAHACWLLVQHSPHEFQQHCLPLMRAAVTAGHASERDLVYLQDRVDMHANRPQHHGTQHFGTHHSPMRLWPVTDPSGLNARRARLDLPPITDDVLADAWTSDTLAERNINLEPGPPSA